jgi:hypothetical protein
MPLAAAPNNGVRPTPIIDSLIYVAGLIYALTVFYN